MSTHIENPLVAVEEFKMFKRILWEVVVNDRKSMEARVPGREDESLQFEFELEGNKTIWTMLFYPNGDTVESSKHIGLFLNLFGMVNNKFHVSFQLGILGTGGANNYIGYDLQLSGQEFQTIPGFGQDMLISHNDLYDESNGLIADGKITLYCDMTLSTMKEVTLGNDLIFNHLDFYTDYQKMFENELFVDFALQTNDGQVLRAHKVILSARSPVFFAMLTSNMREAHQSVVLVPDFDSRVMLEVLRYIYVNEVQSLNEISRELVFAAEKYQILALKEICLVNILQSLRISNVVESFLIADRVSNAGKLFSKCVEIIMSNYRDIIKSSEWLELPKDLIAKFTYEALTRSNTIHV